MKLKTKQILKEFVKLKLKEIGVILAFPIIITSIIYGLYGFGKLMFPFSYLLFTEEELINFSFSFWGYFGMGFIFLISIILFLIGLFFFIIVFFIWINSNWKKATKIVNKKNKRKNKK